MGDIDDDGNDDDKTYDYQLKSFLQSHSRDTLQGLTGASLPSPPRVIVCGRDRGDRGNIPSENTGWLWG